MPEMPSNRPNPTFETVEEAAAYYAGAFEDAFDEATRCQNALLEIRGIAQTWMEYPERFLSRLDADRSMFGRIFKLADDALNFSTVQDTNPGTGDGANAGFSGTE